MKMTDIKGLSEQELTQRIREEKANLTKLQFSNAVTPLESPAKIKLTRKLIARLITERRSRQLAKANA